MDCPSVEKTILTKINTPLCIWTICHSSKTIQQVATSALLPLLPSPLHIEMIHPYSSLLLYQKEPSIRSDQRFLILLFRLCCYRHLGMILWRQAASPSAEPHVLVLRRRPITVWQPVWSAMWNSASVLQHHILLSRICWTNSDAFGNHIRRCFHSDMGGLSLIQLQHLRR